MTSHLLEGMVQHRRARPFTYQLEHRVWYAALDLAELDGLDRRLRLFARNRRALATFRDDDHVLAGAADVEGSIRALLREAGDAPDGWGIVLVTNLRTAGYVFNPASFYLCRDPQGVLRAIVVEVHNTFGERHRYLLRRCDDAAGARPFGGSMAKAFFVSPFIDNHGQYRVTVRDDRDGLRLAIALRQDGEHLLSTSLVLRRLPLTDRSLLRMLVRHPLMSHRTTALIHWHALRLWRRGAPFFRHRADGPGASVPAGGAVVHHGAARHAEVTR
jgi:DUF1365 family protein